MPSVNDALYRYGGMYGAAYAPGVAPNPPKLLSDVVEVTAAVEINRIEVPIVGTTKQGYKPGRESREGSIRIHQIDSEWHMEVYRYLSQGLSERRANRDKGKANLRPFTIIIEHDDPDALGVERWQLDGCLIWRMQLGFSITDDITDREFPLTWEEERPLDAFKITAGLAASGLPKTEKLATNGTVPKTSGA